MKWLKKLLGMEPVATSSAPADAGAKAFDNMANTLSTPPAPEPKVEAVVVAEPAPEVKVEEAVVEAKPKVPRKPRAKKAPTAPIAPLPQTVVHNVELWPFPGNSPLEGEKKAKPAARTVKAK